MGLTPERPAAYRHEKCRERSPVAKFDEGPVYCELEDGHFGAHMADEPPEHRVPGYLPNKRKWKDGHFV